MDRNMNMGISSEIMYLSPMKEHKRQDKEKHKRENPDVENEKQMNHSHDTRMQTRSLFQWSI